MKWTVIFQPSAKDELASLWLNSTDRKAVADAADAIDQILRTNPLAAGESRDGDMRLLIEPPLAVLFDVEADDRKVTVWLVRRWC